MINYGISYQKIKLGSYLFYRGLESLSSGARNSKGRRRADKREARRGITGQDIVVLLTQGRIKEFNEAREREEALYYVDLHGANLDGAQLRVTKSSPITKEEQMLINSSERWLSHLPHL